MTKYIFITLAILFIFILWAERSSSEILDDSKALFALIGILSTLAILSVVNFWLPS